MPVSPMYKVKETIEFEKPDKKRGGTKTAYLDLIKYGRNWYSVLRNGKTLYGYLDRQGSDELFAAEVFEMKRKGWVVESESNDPTVDVPDFRG